MSHTALAFVRLAAHQFGIEAVVPLYPYDSRLFCCPIFVILTTKCLWRQNSFGWPILTGLFIDHRGMPKGCSSIWALPTLAHCCFHPPSPGAVINSLGLGIILVQEQQAVGIGNGPDSRLMKRLRTSNRADHGPKGKGVGQARGGNGQPIDWPGKQRPRGMGNLEPGLGNLSRCLGGGRRGGNGKGRWHCSGGGQKAAGQPPN